MKTIRLLCAAALLPLVSFAQVVNLQQPAATYTDNEIPRRNGTGNQFQASSVVIDDAASSNITIGAATSANDITVRGGVAGATIGLGRAATGGVTITAAGTNQSAIVTPSGTGGFGVNATPTSARRINSAFSLTANGGTINSDDVTSFYNLSTGSGGNSDSIVSSITGVATHAATGTRSAIGVIGIGRTAARDVGAYFSGDGGTVNIGLVAIAGSAGVGYPTHTGTSAGLVVSNSTNPVDIIRAYDSTTPVFIVADGGNVLLGGVTTNGGDVLQLPTSSSMSFGTAGTKAYVYGESSGRLILGTNNATAVTVDSSQNTAFAGVTIMSTDTLSGAGAISVTKDTTKFTSTGSGQALTLANGTDGQIKHIIHDVDGGSGVLTPTTKTGFSTVTFVNAGDSVSLEYVTTRGWIVIGSYGSVIAP